MEKPTSNTRIRLEKKVYMDAVWDYMLDHSDITKGGQLFVKFHTDDRKTFERHVIARVKGYHRNDPIEKEAVLHKTKEAFVSEKSAKKQKARAEKLQRIEKQEEIKRRVKEAEKINKMNRFYRRIYLFFRD